MGEEWKRARDARVAEVARRQTIFSSYAIQQRMINEIKAPLTEATAVLTNPASGYGIKLKALMKLRTVDKAFQQFPEPTKENTWHPNSHRIIEIRDEFFQHSYGLSAQRLKLLRTGINFVIIIYDYDPPYRMMIDWWAKQLQIQNWRYDIPIRVGNYDWSGWWREDI